jgi:hypothetical protein
VQRREEENQKIRGDSTADQAIATAHAPSGDRCSWLGGHWRAADEKKRKVEAAKARSFGSKRIGLGAKQTLSSSVNPPLRTSLILACSSLPLVSPHLSGLKCLTMSKIQDLLNFES